MNNFPARFKHGDLVNINCGDAGLIEGCTVTMIHFSEGFVNYDVIVSDSGITIDNIPSFALEPAERDLAFEQAIAAQQNN